MNIFFLSLNPKICAMWHGDSHVIKMILESTQILFTCGHLLNPEWVQACPYTVYKKTHENHPSVIWARESYSNFFYLIRLGVELCLEKERRWVGNKPHACKKILLWMLQNPLPSENFERLDMTPVIPAMPIEFKEPREETIYDSMQLYREYYRYKYDTGIVKYSKIPDRKPEWIFD